MMKLTVIGIFVVMFVVGYWLDRKFDNWFGELCANGVCACAGGFLFWALIMGPKSLENQAVFQKWVGTFGNRIAAMLSSDDTDEVTSDDEPATSSPSPPTAPADDDATTPVAATPQPPRKVLADVEDVVWVEGSKQVTFPDLPRGQWWVIMYEDSPPNGVFVTDNIYKHDAVLENVRVYIQEGDVAITFITPVTPRPAAPPASAGSDDTDDDTGDAEPADPST